MSMKQGAKPYDELVAELNASYGLDKPVLEGYFVWLGKALHGEFGESWIFHQPVTKKFSSVIWYSFVLALASFLLEIIIAIPLGIISATKQYSKSRLCGDSVCPHRYFPAVLLLCHYFEMDLLHQSEMGGPVWYCKPYA